MVGTGTETVLLMSGQISIHPGQQSVELILGTVLVLIT